MLKKWKEVLWELALTLVVAVIMITVMSSIFIWPDKFSLSALLCIGGVLIGMYLSERLGVMRGKRKATRYDIEDNVYEHLYEVMMEYAEDYHPSKLNKGPEAEERYHRYLMAAARISAEYDLQVWKRQQEVDPDNKVMVLDVLRQRRHLASLDAADNESSDDNTPNDAPRLAKAAEKRRTRS